MVLAQKMITRLKYLKALGFLNSIRFFQIAYAFVLSVLVLGGTDCNNNFSSTDTNPPPALPPPAPILPPVEDCPKHVMPGVQKHCWDFSQGYTKDDLMREGWTLDPCWQLTQNTLTTLQFPDSGKPFDSGCTIFLPTLNKLPQESGQYILKVVHSAVGVYDKADNVASFSSAYIYFPKKLQQTTLFSVTKGAFPNSTSLFNVDETPYQLYLKQSVLAYNQAMAGNWTIQRIEILPVPSMQPDCPKEVPVGTQKYCWDFSQKYTLEELKQEGWTFDDACFNTSSGNSLQNSYQNASETEGICNATLPKMQVASQESGRYQVSMLQEVLLEGESNSANLILDSPSGTPSQRLFGLQEWRLDVPIPFQVNPQNSFNLRLQMRVGVGSLVPVGAWNIKRIKITPQS